MDYLNVAEAREKPGLRLVLTAGLPGPWGEAIKSILAFKGIPFQPVAQLAGDENAALVEWTGQASAPVIVFNDEPPRVSWLDQLMLAERLVPERTLLPAGLDQRALVIGLCREVAGENGLGWLRRLELLGPGIGDGTANEQSMRMARRYGWSPETFAKATPAALALLRGFCARILGQRQAGSDYLVGDALSAADLYLANFIGMYYPLPEALNPMPSYLREVYSRRTGEQDAVLEAGLLGYRDTIVKRHIRTPMTF